MTKIRVVLLVAACLPAYGCASEATPPAYTEHDSAGVRIVEYRAELPTQPVLSLSSRPLYRNGDEAGEREWQQVFPGVLLSDGSVVVADRSEVVWIGTDGAVRSVLAKKGQGPAEIGSVSGIQAVGPDTVFVQDGGNGKVLVFEGGAFTRSVPLPDQLRLASAVGVVPPRTVLLATSGYRQLVDPWLVGHLIRFDLGNPIPDTVGVFDAFPYRDVQARGPMNPFSSKGIANASGHLFVTGREDIPQISWWSQGGGLRQVLRWNAARTYPTAETLAQLLDSLRAIYPRMTPGLSNEAAEELIARQNYELQAGQPLPLFGMILGDGEGGVWISEYPIGSTELRHWSLFGSDGVFVGSVTLPDRFRILDVRGKRVLGVLSDSMDVESVAVFELGVR